MVPKVYVTSKMTALFSCSECGKSEIRDVSKFIGHKSKIRLKYKCKCKHKFSVDLERRRSKRKSVKMRGNIKAASKKYNAIIEDISKHGLKIGFSEKISFEENQTIEVEFFLDVSQMSKVTRQVRVKKNISKTMIGCEFLSADHYGELGKYFLFEY